MKCITSVHAVVYHRKWQMNVLMSVNTIDYIVAGRAELLEPFAAG